MLLCAATNKSNCLSEFTETALRQKKDYLTPGRLAHSKIIPIFATKDIRLIVIIEDFGIEHAGVLYFFDFP